MAKQQRRIIFFLGAGASFGAGASAKVQAGGHLAIPTQSTFWETFLRLCRGKKNKKDIENFLFRYFLGYAKAPGRAQAATRRRQLQPIDVEEVFTFLSERNNAPGVSPQLRVHTLRVWNALLAEVGQVFRRFESNNKTRAIYRTMKRRHIRTRDTIVSFNYDVVFERSLPAQARWYYEKVDEHHQAQALRILKPHGSINWKEVDGRIASVRKIVDYPAQPIVIAPTHLKFIGVGEPDDDGARPRVGYLNQSEQVPEVWSAMEREMKAAKAWVFIGYSFPPSDLYFASVLRSTLADRDTDPFIIIVNPDSMAIQQRLRSRFSIPENRIRTFSGLDTFNQLDRDALMSLF